MKLLYLSADDSGKKSSENNGYYIRSALARSGIIVTAYSPRKLTFREVALLGPAKAIYRGLGRDFRLSVEPMVVNRQLEEIKAKINRAFPDIIFANSPGIAYGLTGDTPVVIYTDAPIVGLLEMGHYYDSWADRSKRRFLEIDRSSLHNAKKVIFHSEWAAKVAESRYGVSRDKTAVVLPGANFAHVDSSLAAIDKRRGPMCELLFWGRDWARKGGPQAVEVLSELNRQGVAARLTVCGPKSLPSEVRDRADVRFLGLLSKNTREDLDTIRQLFQSTDYMLLPTKADASTAAIREAGAYGIPSIVPNVGGLSELIDNGHSGFLISGQSNTEEYVKVITQNFSNESERIAMRGYARSVYDTRLNWEVAGEKLAAILRSIR